MFKILLAAVTAVTVSGAAIQPRAAPETFYLANCQSNLVPQWSEIDYYKAGHDSSTVDPQGNYPDDGQKTSSSGYYTWEGGERTITFANSGTSFTFNIDKNAQQEALYSKVGSAHNKYHNYDCKRDNNRVLYRASGGGYGAACESIYYCQIA